MIVGLRRNGKVYIDDHWLNPRDSQRLYNHSPDGFAWGYGGSGPAQLALALLLYYTSERFALRYYQKFKFEVIANCRREKDLLLDPRDVQKWIEERQ